ncbi:MAG TPA: hypothetical protein P5233_07470 [Candidatus Paceibacterota bacterium]|nr:hypothetical protein [Candidatus Paceibacterota bacterium]
MKKLVRATLLDLRLALHIPRRLSSASSIEFLGRTWKIAPTRLHSALIIHRPNQRLWVVPPTKTLSKWPDVLGRYTLQLRVHFRTIARKPGFWG